MSEDENQRLQTGNFLCTLLRVHNNMWLFKLDVLYTENFDVSDLVSGNCCYLVYPCCYSDYTAHQASEAE